MASKILRSSLRKQAWHNPHYVFWANYMELKHALETLKKPEVSFKLSADYHQLEMIALDIVRLLHNYLSAAYTLKEHTYKLREIYKDTDFEKEYEIEKNKAFVDSPISEFVKRLRNYVLHAGLPLTSTAFQLGNFQTLIRLNTRQLLESGEFTGKARQYLETLGDNVILDQVIEEHAGIVLKFYDWLFKRQQEIQSG